MSDGLLGQIKKGYGRNTLCVRVLREPGGWVCERTLVESDKRSQVHRTQVLPFRTLDVLRDFLEHDPHFPDMRREVEHLLRKVAFEVGHGH